MTLPAAGRDPGSTDPIYPSPSTRPFAPITEEDQLENLVARLYEAPDLQQTMDRFLAFAVSFLGSDHATIALRHRTSITPGAATDESSHAALIAQLDCGEGPCLTAISTGLSVLVPDTAAETRWPLWTREVTPRGRSIFAIPLSTAGITFGALTLIGEQPHTFNAADAKAPRLATYGAAAIASARQHQSLVEAVETNQRIGQAVGILRERYSIDEGRAFDILRRYSQHCNLKLRDVADQLLDTGLLPTTSRKLRNILHGNS
jgi:transcriptional regulator with GAF, ATPase, and Fis domain